MKPMKIKSDGRSSSSPRAARISGPSSTPSPSGSDLSASSSKRLNPKDNCCSTACSPPRLDFGHRTAWHDGADAARQAVLCRACVTIDCRTELETELQAGQAVIHVPSANSPECLQAIEESKPGVVLLAGCRLLSKETLAQMPCPVLNYHAGIAPKYRGMNGGYWALASGDADNFGTTVHLVDAGVDTGGVLRQARGRPRARRHHIKLCVAAGGVFARHLRRGGSGCAGGKTSHNRSRPAFEAMVPSDDLVLSLDRRKGGVW